MCIKCAPFLCFWCHKFMMRSFKRNCWKQEITTKSNVTRLLLVLETRMKHRIKEQNVPFPITVNSATSVKTGRSQGVDFTANTFYKLDSRPLPASHVTVEGPPTILPPIRAWRREQRDNSPGDTTGREAFPETFRAQETHCVVRL